METKQVTETPVVFELDATEQELLDEFGVLALAEYSYAAQN
jgi:hypothetical protein